MLKRLILLTISFIPLAGCSLLYPTKTPIDSTYYMTGKKQSDSLIIMLPGRGDGPEDFVKYGFIKILNRSEENPDAILVDAHFGYYYGRNLIPRLYEDVVMPARQNGYKNIWLLGISMGGLGALLYAKEHPETINGLLLLAPFLGDREMIEEISNSGGLAKWNPWEPVADEDYQRQLWLWLKEYVKTQDGLPRIAIGWGLDDKFAEANRLLAVILPDGRSYTVPGGHDWDPWRNLFRQFMDHGLHGLKDITD